MDCTTRDFVSIGLPALHIQQIFAWKTELRYAEITSLLHQTQLDAAKITANAFNAQCIVERMATQLNGKKKADHAEPCMDFNKTICRRPFCRFEHVCVNCNGDHPSTRCTH